MLTAAADDLHEQRRVVFGVAPTAKAARILERDTGIASDTVAKLLHEWHRTDRPPLPEFQLAAGATLIVDEAGMISTPALHQLVTLAEANRWRLALVGDPRQLQGVGRGGLLAELCTNGRVEQLERLHRFTHRLGGRRVAAAAIRRPTRLRRLRDPRPDHPRHPRAAPRPHGRHLDRDQAARPNRGIGGVDQRSRRHHQRRHPTSPARRRPPRPTHRNRWSPVASTPTSATSSRPAATIGASSPRPAKPVRNRDTWTVTAIGRRRFLDRVAPRWTRRRHPPRRLRP